MNPISEIKRLYLIAGFIESRHLQDEVANALLSRIHERVAFLVQANDIPADKLALIEQLERGVYNTNYDGYKWVKVGKYVDDPSKTWEERYAALSAHHIAETTFLIDKIREMAGTGDK